MVIEEMGSRFCERVAAALRVKERDRDPFGVGSGGRERDRQ